MPQTRKRVTQEVAKNEEEKTVNSNSNHTATASTLSKQRKVKPVRNVESKVKSAEIPVSKGFRQIFNEDDEVMDMQVQGHINSDGEIDSEDDSDESDVEESAN